MPQVNLQKVRIAFIKNLFTPAEYEAGDGKYRRSATFIIEPDSENAKKLSAAVKQAAAEAWKDKATAMLKTVTNDKGKFCIVKDKTGQNGEVYEGFEGKLSVTANRAEKQGPVLVVNRDGRSVLSEGSGVIYGGCYVNANVEIYAQSGKFFGIRCSLSGVQFHSDGEAFSGGAGPIEAFKDLTEGAESGEVVEDEEFEDNSSNALKEFGL